MFARVVMSIVLMLCRAGFAAALAISAVAADDDDDEDDDDDDDDDEDDDGVLDMKGATSELTGKSSASSAAPELQLTVFGFNKLWTPKHGSQGIGINPHT